MICTRYPAHDFTQHTPLRHKKTGYCVPSSILVDNSEAFLSCGLAGLGILHGLRPSLAPFIASGELTEILTDFPPPPKPVSLLYPDRRYLAPKDAHGLDVFNALSVQAATTAWNESRQWLDSLLDYLAENRRWFVEQATEHLPWARIVPAQGTYLLWMDCKKLGLDDEQLKWVMADVAGIAPSMGSGFGPAGSGFIRLNLGCPRTYLEMAIDGLKRISVKTIKGIPTGG